MKNKITIPALYDMKQAGNKITALTAYTYDFAGLVDESGIDIILVGDSAAMMVQGEPNTLPITMDEMIYHTRLVSKAVKRAMVIGDMPFMSYQVSEQDAIKNAGRFIKEGHANAVKLEGGASVSHLIKAITKAGIAVQAHIGLLPQSVNQMGGYKVQKNENKLMDDALEVQNAGAFSVVLEGIPAEIAAKITKSLQIPTIGIGAGPECDGQIIVMHDLLGLNMGHVAKFVKKYANLGEESRNAMKQYVEEVKNKTFPSSEHSY
ncbi:MAG: 3-methyl-2-oxobutanoate hydroxymethyltransferase [Desulfobacterales bacterium]|nr:3-methyl-2-oxobutanoate hydroxymethyltransferase [Desulfobacterales bacterium]